jgi:hypothetical protein
MSSNSIRHTTEFSARLRRELALFDVRPAGPYEVAAARALCADLIGPSIVSADDLDRVQRQTAGTSVFVTEEDGALCGVLALVLLNGAGLKAVLDGGFDAQSPAAAHLAGPGEVASAFYGWGVAATTKASAHRVVDAARAVMSGTFGPLPKFARPTTEAGHRLMRERLAFIDLPGSADGLVWQAPLEQAAAA